MEQSLILDTSHVIVGGHVCALSLSHVPLFVTPWTVRSLPGSSVHGIPQARILEWVAISSSRASS